MKRFIALIVLLAAPTYAQARMDITGQRVTVETDRYKVVVDGLTITQIENKLTGEVYAASPADGTANSPALTQMLADRGVAIESLRPAVPVKRFGIGDKTKVTSHGDPDGATMTFVGLQYGAGEQAEFAENMTIKLGLRIDAKTGDLLITPDVKGNIEEIHGVRDRGVLRNSLHLLNLAGNLKLIIPANDGTCYTSANVPPEWADNVQRLVWPMSWEAGLLIAESDKGCLGVWADEAPLKYGRILSMCRSGGRWETGFEFETSDAIYRCDEIKSATWHFNVFAGYWARAAERYQQQMISQWHMKPLAEQQPAWADKVRIVLGSSTPQVSGAEEASKMFPRDSMIVFTSQGWLLGWNNGDMLKHGENYHPNYPIDNPVRWEGVPEFAEQAKALEAMNVHVFPYTNPTQIELEKHPWIRDKIRGRNFWTWKLWQRFYPELCLDIVKRYGVSAIYEDCSWNHYRNTAGEPDGDNWYNGSVHMREYFRELMPDIPIMGERNNEVTARGQQFALGWVRDAEHTHPISSYLFDPFVRMWNLGDVSFPNQTFDTDDIRGYPITVLNPDQLKGPIQENWMILKRAEIFAHEQLTSYWPQTWDANVRHYFKSKNGVEYRYVSDRGSRFVKVMPDGSQETIYWRLHGVRDADAPGAGIEGWVGYDGDKIVGLNPAVLQYVTSANVTRPPAVIAAVPEGYVIHRSVVRDGYWLVTLEAADQLKTAAAPDAKEAKAERAAHMIRVRSAKPLQFAGVETVRQVAEGEYDVQVALPGGFAAYWTAPETLTAGPIPPATMMTAHDRHSGVVYHRYPNPNINALPTGEVPLQEATTTWLFKTPPEPLHLAFGYGTDHGYGDGANYMVRVNGRELWKEHRQQGNAADQINHTAPPISQATVDLSAYAGQIITLELAINGHLQGGSETFGWAQPRFEK